MKFDHNIKVYVINCDVHTERLAKFKKYAHKANLDFTRQKCVNGKKFTDSKIMNFINNGILSKNADMTPIEVAINMSFIKVWQKIIKSKNDYGIILEDDALVSRNFISDVNDILNSLDAKNKKFDVIFLQNGNFANTKSKQKKILTTKLNKIHILQETVGFNAGGPAYIITKNFAKYMLDHIFPIRMPHDMHMGYTKGKKFFTIKMKKNEKGCWEGVKPIVKVTCDGEYGTGSSTQDYSAPTIKKIYKKYR